MPWVTLHTGFKVKGQGHQVALGGCSSHHLQGTGYSVAVALQFTLLVTITLRASCGLVYCYRFCLWVCGCVGGWVCYHDNSKLLSSIFTKLDL